MTAATAAGCGDPGVLGVARVLTLDTQHGLEVGTFSFPRTLPLGDMEVVLTFDDGPMPGVTERVLSALRNECVRATFFDVGRMAASAPGLVRATAADGHTIANHTLNHVMPIGRISVEAGIREVNGGFAALAAALGQQPAPFFRFPGFALTQPLESRLAAAGIGTFSTDVMGYDWNPISADQVRAYVLAGLARKRGGIVLLHDIHRRTADMLPQLLRDLRERGYKIVHIVPAGPCPAVGCRID
ncbi:MAG: polysaccharide deacetylase family protein [Bauldia sp.]